MHNRIIALLIFFCIQPELLYAQSAVSAEIESSFVEAEAAANAGDYRSAAVALERILILDPTLDNIRLELGVLYLRLGATDLAEEFIREALASPNAPPEVRSRAEELLEMAVDENRRFRWSGEFTAGMISDSNANAGPDAGALGPGIILSPDSTGQGDISAYAILGGHFRYDPGLQAGHLLALDVEVYGRSYREQTQLNVKSYSLQPGIDFNLSQALKIPAILELRYVYDELWEDGEKYVAEHGLEAKLTLGVGITGVVSANLRSVDQNYFENPDNPANDEQDGRRTTFGASYRGVISEYSAYTLGFGVTNKSADVGYEAYNGGFVTAGYEHAFDDVFGSKHTLIFDVSAVVGRRDYDSPDPIFVDLGVNGAQWERFRSAEIGLSVPILSDSVVRTSVGYTENDSNYGIDTYDNTYVVMEFKKNF